MNNYIPLVFKIVWSLCFNIFGDFKNLIYLHAFFIPIKKEFQPISAQFSRNNMLLFIRNAQFFALA